MKKGLTVINRSKWQRQIESYTTCWSWGAACRILWGCNCSKAAGYKLRIFTDFCPATKKISNKKVQNFAISSPHFAHNFTAKPLKRVFLFFYQFIAEPWPPIRYKEKNHNQITKLTTLTPKAPVSVTLSRPLSKLRPKENSCVWRYKPPPVAELSWETAEEIKAVSDEVRHHSPASQSKKGFREFDLGSHRWCILVRRWVVRRHD